MSFAELSITSNFTFLTGASHAEEYVDRAALLGIEALAIADEMHRLLDLGVDGIMTDEPTTLRAVFDERGLWPH